MNNFLLISSSLSFYGLLALALYSFSNYAHIRQRALYLLPFIFLTFSFAFYQMNRLDIASYYSFLIILVMFFIVFKIFFQERNLYLYFGAIHHMFYIFVFRAFYAGLFSLLWKIPIAQMNRFDPYALFLFQLATLSSILYFVYSKNRFLSSENVALLLRNERQLRFVLFVKTVLGFYLMLITYGAKYSVNMRWFAILHLATSLTVAFVAITALKNGIEVAKVMDYERQTKALERQLEMQVNHYRSYQDYTENFREFRHDYKKMLSSLNVLLRNNKIEEAVRILDDMGVVLSTKIESHQVYSNNLILDALLQDFANRSKEQKVAVDFRLYWDHTIDIEELVLVRIFTNLLENALEANQYVASDQRFISIESRNESAWLLIKISNRFDGRLNPDLQTRKKENQQRHGLGVGIVAKTMDDLGGSFTWEHEDYVFNAYLTFPKR